MRCWPILGAGLVIGFGCAPVELCRVIPPESLGGFLPAADEGVVDGRIAEIVLAGDGERDAGVGPLEEVVVYLTEPRDGHFSVGYYSTGGTADWMDVYRTANGTFAARRAPPRCDLGRIEGRLGARFRTESGRTFALIRAAHDAALPEMQRLSLYDARVRTSDTEHVVTFSGRPDRGRAGRLLPYSAEIHLDRRSLEARDIFRTRD